MTTSQSVNANASRLIIAMIFIVLPTSVQVVMTQPVGPMHESAIKSNPVDLHVNEIIQTAHTSIPPTEYRLAYRENAISSSPSALAEATVLQDALESQPAQLSPEPPILPQIPSPTSFNILVDTGPMAISIAGVVIMGINVLTLAAIVVIATVIYRRRDAPREPTKLSVDTARLNTPRPVSSYNYNTFELKDQAPYLHAIQEDFAGLGASDRSSSPVTPSSFRFPARGSAQEINIHPIPGPRKKLSLSSLTNLAGTVTV